MTATTPIHKLATQLRSFCTSLSQQKAFPLTICRFVTVVRRLGLTFNSIGHHRRIVDFIAQNPVICNPKALMITFALLALIACVGISCVPIYLLGRGVFARARDYFVASEHTPPGVVRNSSIAYSLQI